MNTYKTEYRRGIALLLDAGVPDATVDAWYLFEHVTGLTKASYLLKEEEEMPGHQMVRYEELLHKRAERVPLQYITGEQEFMGFPFKVSRATLIPRQDTEVLVEEVLKYTTGKRVLDLCTGTGCIITSLAKLSEMSYAVGTDISSEAVETARQNAAALDADVKFYCGDLFEALPRGEVFDVIVSNPPYIPSAVIKELMPEVRKHEPMTALDGDADGLKFYRQIIGQAKKYLSENGRIFFEIGREQAEDIRCLLEAEGFQEVYVKKDYAGLDRVVGARRSQE